MNSEPSLAFQALSVNTTDNQLSKEYYKFPSSDHIPISILIKDNSNLDNGLNIVFSNNASMIGERGLVDNSKLLTKNNSLFWKNILDKENPIEYLKKISNTMTPFLNRIITHYAILIDSNSVNECIKNGKSPSSYQISLSYITKYINNVDISKINMIKKHINIIKNICKHCNTLPNEYKTNLDQMYKNIIEYLQEIKITLFDKLIIAFLTFIDYVLILENIEFIEYLNSKYENNETLLFTTISNIYKNVKRKKTYEYISNSIFSSCLIFITLGGFIIKHKLKNPIDEGLDTSTSNYFNYLIFKQLTQIVNDDKYPTLLLNSEDYILNGKQCEAPNTNEFSSILLNNQQDKFKLLDTILYNKISNYRNNTDSCFSSELEKKVSVLNPNIFFKLTFIENIKILFINVHMSGDQDIEDTVNNIITLLDTSTKCLKEKLKENEIDVIIGGDSNIYYSAEKIDNILFFKNKMKERKYNVLISKYSTKKTRPDNLFSNAQSLYKGEEPRIEETMFISYPTNMNVTFNSNIYL